MLIKLALVLLFIFPVTAFGQQSSKEILKKVEFQIISSKSFVQNESRNDKKIISEEINFLSTDKVEAFLLIEYHKTRQDAENALLEKLKILDKCSEKKPVVDEENNSMGIAYNCEVESPSSKNYVALYSYGSDIFELKSVSLSHLDLLLSDFCPRSGDMRGRTCPAIYLKRNWIKN